MLRHAGGDSVVSKLVEAGTGHSPQAELENPGGESRAEAQLGLKSQLSTEEAPTI